MLRDLDGWLESNRASVLARVDLPARVSERVGGPVFLSRARLDAHHEGPLVQRVQELSASLDGPVLDLGCGSGWHGRGDAVGLDGDLDAARRAAHGVVGDAADPPFAGSSFETVLLLNLLDSTRDPRMVLAQADALLRPGGTLLISCAYAFDHTPYEARFTDAQLMATLGGDPSWLGMKLGYDVLETHEALEWRIVQSPRRSSTFQCRLVRAVKSA